MKNKIEIIAEIAQGYEGNEKLADLLTKGAIASNADAVKFQIYSGPGLLTKSHPRFSHFTNQAFSPEQWSEIINPLIKGILLSALIAILVPSDFFVSYKLTGLVAMVVIGLTSIPIYVCATASVPIAMTLISKGLDPGAAFVFLMAGPATNAATISVIMNSLGKKIIYIYISVIFASAIFFGTLINIFLDPATIPSPLSTGHLHGWLWGGFSDISVILMILITLYATINHLSPKSKKITPHTKTADLSLMVKGMTCNHCKETATEAIQSCDGVEKISINLETGNTLIYGQSINETQIIESINSVGFSVSKFE